MNFDLSFMSGQGLVMKQAVDALLQCNDQTAQFGLVLTQSQAAALVATRFEALKVNGRVEFGGGVVEKLIDRFCDSPNISSWDYEKTLHELIEAFYYYKNETLDLISDDDLIRYMKTAYDGVCQGSLSLLIGRELDNLARNLRGGNPPECEEENNGDA